MLIPRSRKFRDSDYRFNESSQQNVHEKHRYARYFWNNRVTTGVDKPQSSIVGAMTHKMDDYVHKIGTPVKWIKPPLSRDMSRYYEENNPTKFVNHSRNSIVQFPAEPEILITKITDLYENRIKFVGLPHECRTYWGFIEAVIPAVHRQNDQFRFGTGPIFDSFAKMNKDSSLLNLHDQNIFTSIGELKDFKKTIETVTKHRISGKYPADKYLGINFGILPFYSDVKNYIDNWNNFAPSLQKWNEIGNSKDKVLNAHRTFYKKKEEGVFNQLYSGTYNYPDGLSTYRYRFEFITDYKLVGKTHMYFEPLPLESKDKLELVASINGLKQPLSAAWNLIPFSFIVDWFTNAGDMIETLERCEPVLRYNIVGACYAMKLQVLSQCHVYFHDNQTGDEVYLGRSTRDVEFFRRYPYRPDEIKDYIFKYPVSSPLTFTPELTGYQWSLAAALAVTLTKK